MKKGPQHLCGGVFLWKNETYLEFKKYSNCYLFYKYLHS